MTTIMKVIKSLPGLKITDFEDRSLLIVDDDDPLRMRLSRAMEKKGFQVKDAKTVENAIKMVASNPPKFALVDLRLEDGNGLDVVKLSLIHISEPTRPERIAYAGLWL